MFVNSVVVARDDAGPDVNVLADRGIAQISEVHGFRPGAKRGVLDLHKVADLYGIRQLRGHPKVSIGSGGNLFTERTVHDYTTLQHYAARADS